MPFDGGFFNGNKHTDKLYISLIISLTNAWHHVKKKNSTEE